MKKIILHFDHMNTRAGLHSYLAEKLDFPDYYGKNLDALYDCLTDISEYTAIGFFRGTDNEDLIDYILQAEQAFRDAEEYNPYLAVIFGDENKVYLPEEDYLDSDELPEDTSADSEERSEKLTEESSVGSKEISKMIPADSSIGSEELSEDTSAFD